MSCAFTIDDIRAHHRRTLVSLGRYRRLSDFITASLCFLRTDGLLRAELVPDTLRDRAAGTWHGTPSLSALHAHLNRLHRDHPGCGLRLVTAAPGAPLAHLANLWIGGGTSLAFGAGGGGLAALSARLDEARTLFAHALADAPSASDALARAVADADDSGGLVVCAVDVERADTPFLDGAHPCLRSARGAVLPVLLRQGRIGSAPGYASMDDAALAAALGDAGFRVHAVDLGLQFEARLYAALEASLHALVDAPQAADGHPIIVLSVPRSLAMPPAVSTAIDQDAAMVMSRLRADAALFQAFRTWLEGYVPYDLVQVDGVPDLDILALLPPRDAPSA